MLAGPLQAWAATDVHAQVQARQVQLDLPAQPLDQALTAFADQASLHLLYTTGDVAGLRSPALQGSYSIEQALQLLLAGSDMAWQFNDARTVTLRKAEPAAQAVNLKPIEVSVASRTSTAISEIPGTVWGWTNSSCVNRSTAASASRRPSASWCQAWTWRPKGVPTMARTCVGAMCW